MNENMEIAVNFLGPLGKLISHSKSGYTQKNPENLVVFNANICTSNQKIWWGDMDITVSKENLQSLSIALNENIYVLRELDGRFEHEESPLISNYVVGFTPEGQIIKSKIVENSNNNYNL